MEVRQGTGSDNEAQSVTAYTLFRGLDGDRTNKAGTGAARSVTVTDSAEDSHTDHAWLAGKMLEERRRRWVQKPNNDWELETREWVLRKYWTQVTATYDGLPDARMVREDYTRYRTMVAAGADLEREVFTTYDGYGRVQTVGDHGQTGVDDNTCTMYDYADNTDYFDSSPIQRWMVGYVDVTRVYADDCATSTDSDMRSHAVTLYDGATNVNASNKPVDGLVTASRTLMGASATGAWIGSKATYDGVGRVLTSTTGLSNTVTTGTKTTTTYTPATEFPYNGVKVTVDGKSTTTWSSSQWGVVTSVKDPNNQTTNVRLDGAGRVVGVVKPGDTVTTPGASDDKPSVKVTYSIPMSISGVPGMVNTPPKVSTSTLLSTSYVTAHTYLDGLGRVRQTQAVSPQSVGGGRIVTDTWYTNRGQVRGTTAPTWVTGTSGGAMVDVAFSDYKSFTKTWYDALKRPYLSTLYGEGAVEKATTTTSYDGDKVTVDPPGKAKTVTWSDVYGRATAIDEFYDASVFYRSEYSYTATGLLKSYSDPDDPGEVGNTTTRTYDWAGRMTSQSDPDTGVTSTTYDPAGNPVTTTDAAGVTLSTTFDVLGRPLLTYRGTPSEKLVERVYDTAVKGVGRLASETRFNGPGGTDGYTHTVTGYDGRGRVTGESYSAPASLGSGVAGTYPYAYTYNSSDLPTSITYPAAGGLGSEKVTTGYASSTGVPTSLGTNLSGPSGTSLIASGGVTYTGSGLVETRTLGAGSAAAGVKREFTYDMAIRQASRTITRVGMVADLASATGGTAVQDRSFVFDRVGNPVSIADATITGGTGGTDVLRECFDYDGRSRLTRAWTTFMPMTTAATTTSSDAACAAPVVAATSAGPGGYDTSYAYDRTGNTKSITQNTASPSTLSLAYPTATNAARPHAVTSTSGAATAAYAYHPTGEIATKTAGATSSTYAWTALHELASTTVTTGASSATTRSQYGPGGTRTARVDPSGARTLFLPGMDLSAPSASGTPTATRYYTFDGTSIAARTATGLSWMSGDKAASVEFTITAAATPTVTQRRYTPYGGPRGTWSGTPTQIRTGQGASGTPTLGRGFLGKPEDPTGLVQLDHRPYDPVLTRFLSVDPLLAVDNPQTFNGYSYSHNNPVAYADPSGLYAVYNPAGYWYDNGLQAGSANAADHRTEEKQQSITYKPQAWTPTDRRRPANTNNCGNAVKGCADFSGAHKVLDKVEYVPIVGAMASSANASMYAMEGDYASAATSATGMIPGGKGVIKGAGLLEDVAKHGDDVVDAAGDFCKVNSFTADTLVLMADGTKKPIKDVTLGDYVMAADPITGEEGPRPVTDLIRHGGLHTMVAIRLADGTTIEATDQHPFWDESSGAWVDAIDLRPGSVVITADGDRLTVHSLAINHQNLTAYNLTVADFHTYHVSAREVLVHNSQCISSAIGGDPFLTRAAEVAGKNSQVQRELDGLFAQVSSGNLNPGLGTKSLSGTGISYARSRGGARLFFRNVNGAIQIVGKASKANESLVINYLTRLYGS